MKNTLLILITTLLFSFVGYGQSKSDKMYNVFSDKEGVTNFSFSKNMVDAFDINLGDDEDDRKVTGDLNRIRFMSYNPKKGEFSGNEFLKKAVGYLPKSAYKKYDDKDDEVDGAEIWLMGGRKKYSECHVFVTNDNDKGLRFVVSFYGDFKVEDIDGLKKAGRNFSDD
ncbi:MAG: DUF4252 domain-containing protein [Mariniphaga sp.]|nr:DUF4252 domain-containing protein [Mariniphaga sp.]